MTETTRRHSLDGTVLVTGGAGFIGSNFIRSLFADPDFRGRVLNADALTYAGNRDSLADIEGGGWSGDGRYVFRQVDIADFAAVCALFAEFAVDTVVHFAAESHVDRSILGPQPFIQTNIVGTFHLLEAARLCWRGRSDVRFHHVSTDEVYGSLGAEGAFRETTAYDPRSPYSASKAASDHLVRAYGHTYGLPVTLSNCSNNYGPWQFPEKLVPLMILNAVEGKPLPVYGDGRHVRDWLYVEDHCAALRLVLERGRGGETYNIGGRSERTNIEMVESICAALQEALPLQENERARAAAPHIRDYRELITFVPDRPGHDRRYAIDCAKIEAELGWKPAVDFHEGVRRTVRWYLGHGRWVERVRSGEYREWLQRNYERRAADAPPTKEN